MTKNEHFKGSSILDSKATISALQDVGKITGNLDSVNWHLWERCNYKCKFCFATFPNIRRRLTRTEALKITSLLAGAGVQKINFAGGEPLLCPYISDLILASKKSGMVTSIITNASKLTEDFLRNNARYIDWIGISIDSAKEDTERTLGRGLGNHVALAVTRARMVRRFGIKLKVNTVITSLNYNENMAHLISRIRPDRWKVFQALPINGENLKEIEKLLVSKAQFKKFLLRHKQLNPVGEDNDAMTGSYLMLDPLGQFFQNWGGRYIQSDRILDVGVLSAIDQVGWSQKKFLKRGGIYSW